MLLGIQFPYPQKGLYHGPHLQDGRKDSVRGALHSAERAARPADSLSEGEGLPEQSSKGRQDGDLGFGFCSSLPHTMGPNGSSQHSNEPTIVLFHIPVNRWHTLVLVAAPGKLLVTLQNPGGRFYVFDGYL